MRKSFFPAFALQEALIIAKTIVENNASKPMRRLTLFNTMGKSPGSGTSRSLITASSSYGLTEGGYKAEFIKLKDRGKAIAEKDDNKAKIDAVLGVKVFNAFFQHYKNANIPSAPAAIDFLKEQGVPENQTKKCLQILLKTGEQIKLIQEISGSRRIVSSEHALEVLSEITPSRELPPPPGTSPQDTRPSGEFRLPIPHIDIQIHISADAKPEQIDQIFSSMAKHLYKIKQG